jgi:hypothetical protein
MKEFMSVLGALSISVLIVFAIWPQIFAIWLQISGQHFVHFCPEFVDTISTRNILCKDLEDFF